MGSSPGGSFLGLESPIFLTGLIREAITLEDSALNSEAVARWSWGIRSRFWDSWIHGFTCSHFRQMSLFSVEMMSGSGN